MRRAVSEPLPGAPEPWMPSAMPTFRARPPYLMSEMIGAEPALAERLIRRLAGDASLDTLASTVSDLASRRRTIVMTGCGTSEHAAMGIAALLTEALDLPPGQEIRTVQALDVVRRPLSEGLLVAVSHEGGTHATNEALRAASGAGARTALVTVGGGSPGAALSDLVIATEEQDQSWCHTVGYISPLIVGTVLAARLQRRPPDAAATRALLDVADDANAPSSIAAALAGTDRLTIVGSGHDYITARELALKVAEAARLASVAHDIETVLHGHLAAANRWTGLVLVLTDAATSSIIDRARRVLAASRVLAVATAAILSEEAAETISEEETPAGRIVLPRTRRVPALAGSLLASAIALQLLAERLARSRSVNPDTLGREDAAQARAHS